MFLMSFPIEPASADVSLMPQMRQEIEQLGVENKITLGGIVSREELMENLRKTDIFLFCHKTGESPRCLTEALAAGCALVGYSTAYSSQLVASQGGGEFTNIGNWQALADIIISLNQDRPKLGRLVEAAAASGRLLDRDREVQNRINLVKEYLT
jgi:glycosyltransferase involved in cell wall biosynthesis